MTMARGWSLVLAFVCGMVSAGWPAERSARKIAEGVAQAPRVRAGLCVVVGAADGDLALALARTGMWAVQCFDWDAPRVAAARKVVAKAGEYGTACVDVAVAGTLPLNEDLVNVLITSDLRACRRQGLAARQMVLALAPGGTAFFGNAGESSELDKELSATGMDRCEPVGIAGKTWLCVTKPFPKDTDDWPQLRHDAAMTAMSDDARLGPAVHLRWLQDGRTSNASLFLHSAVESEGRVYFVPSAGSGSAGALVKLETRDAFNGQLLWTARVAAADDDRQAVIARQGMVFTRLRLGGPVVALDAVTGKEVHNYDRAGPMTWHDGHLLIGDTPTQWTMIDPATGDAVRTFVMERPGRRPGILVADKRLYLVEAAATSSATAIVCFDFDTAERLWTQPNVGNGSLYACQGETLLTRGDLSEAYSQPGASPGERTESPASAAFHAFSAGSGGHLWSYAPPAGPEGLDLAAGAFLMGGQVWIYAATPGKAAPGFDSREPFARTGYLSFDPRTGERTGFAPGAWQDFARCGPDYAAARRVLEPEQTDCAAQAARMWWYSPVRGGYAASYLPANGMMYSFGSACACQPYPRGAAAMSSGVAQAPPAHATDRLEKGPAYGKAKPATEAQGDWPTYRADPMRRGAGTARGAADRLAVRWRQQVARRISPPVVAGSTLYVAAIDEHDVLAIDTDRGLMRWTFRAGGRVDSPPTVAGSAVVFGSCDGWVYCLRAEDGRLAWRYLAAPVDRRIVVRSQLESVWPVNGSLVVHNGIVYVVAGRHVGADGGIRLSALDCATGVLLWEKRVADPPYASPSDGLTSGPDTLASYNDLMLCDGKTLYFGALACDLATRRIAARPNVSAMSGGAGTFFYDNTTPLAADRRAFTGITGRTGAVYGNVLSQDATRLYLIDNAYRDRHGAERKPRIAALDSAPQPQLETDTPPDASLQPRTLWERDYDSATLRFKALAAGADRLYVARQPGGNGPTDKGELAVYDAATGTELGAVGLGGSPLFDGLAIAHGRTFVALDRGGLVAFD